MLNSLSGVWCIECKEIGLQYTEKTVEVSVRTWCQVSLLYELNGICVYTRPPMHRKSFNSSLTFFIVRAHSRKMTKMSARKAKMDMTETCMVVDGSQRGQSAIVVFWDVRTQLAKLRWWWCYRERRLCSVERRWEERRRKRIKERASSITRDGFVDSATILWLY